MPDGPKTPRFGTRPHTQTERDQESWAEKQKRDANQRGRHQSPPVGFVQEEVKEEITGNYHGPELQAKRETRDPFDRISRTELKQDRLEAKQDRLEEKLNEHGRVLADTRVEVAGVSGKLDVLPELVSLMKNTAIAQQQREHLTLTAKVEVDKQREEAKIEVDKSDQLDKIKARAERRKRITRVIGAGAGLLGSWEGLKLAIHWIAGHL